MRSTVVHGVPAAPALPPCCYMDVETSRVTESSQTPACPHVMKEHETISSSREDVFQQRHDSWKLRSNPATTPSRMTEPEPQLSPITQTPLFPNATGSQVLPDNQTTTASVQRNRASPHLPSFQDHVSQEPVNIADGSLNLHPGLRGHVNAQLSSSSQVDSAQHVIQPQSTFSYKPVGFPPEKMNMDMQTTSLQIMQEPSKLEVGRNTLLVLDSLRDATQTKNVNSGIPNQQDVGEPTTQITNIAMLRTQKVNNGTSSSSECISEEDPIVYRNARQFPPQLPTHVNSRYFTRGVRSTATHRITNWVSQYEKEHSPEKNQHKDSGREISGDSTSEVNESRILTSMSHAEIEQLWRHIKEKRKELYRIREQMAQTRRELRILRSKEGEADNAFMAVIRPLLVSQQSNGFISSLKLLDSKLAKMLEVREDYHFRESSYEVLELELDAVERELSGLETAFFSLLAAGHGQVMDGRSAPLHRFNPGTTSSINTGTPYELLGIATDRPVEDAHPLYLQLSTAIGDLQNAKDDYKDFVATHAAYKNEQELRGITGQKMTVDAEDFFTSVPSEETTMLSEIKKLEDKTQRLKKLCEEKRVMKRHLSFSMTYLLNPNGVHEDMDLEDSARTVGKHSSLAHPRYSDLLSQPNHVLARPEPMTTEQALRVAIQLPNDDPCKVKKQQLAAKEFAIEKLVQGYNSDVQTDFVNRWLLHQLRLSPLHVLLLQSVFESRGGLKIRDYWRWQYDVMYYWWRDNTQTSGETESESFSTEISQYLGL